MKRMLCIGMLLAFAMSFAACGEDPQVTTQAPTTVTTVPETTVPATTEPPATTQETTVATEPVVTTQETTVVTEPETTAEASHLPYTTNLYASAEIHQGPSKDTPYVRSVGLTGIYTIVEERWDALGNLWGRLKSGVGWVLLNVNTGAGIQICSRCGTTNSAMFLDDWVPGGLCYGCIRDDFHFGEGGGIFCPQCGADCSYRGLCDNGLCEDCNGLT